MKLTLFYIIVICFGFTAFAQESINYKAIINDDNGNVIANESIIVQFAIRTENNSLLYAENHSVITNDNGLVVLQIGEGTPVFQTYNDVDWSAGNLALQVSIDNGNGLVNMGVTPFNTVPYAIETLNPVFEKDGDNAFKETGNVGIGTSTPQEQLHINSPNNLSLLLTIPSINNNNSIRFENGPITEEHSFFEVGNQADRFFIKVDSDLNNGTGYQEILNINNNGDIDTQGSLKLKFGSEVNEFSTDPSLSDNSNTAIPSENAVKTYVDNAINATTEKTLIIPAVAFVSDVSIAPIKYRNQGMYAQKLSANGPIYAPLQLPVGTTITSVKICFRDESSVGNENITASLLRQNVRTNFTFPTTLFILTTFGSSTTGIILEHNDPINITETRQYYFRVMPTSTWGPDDFGVCGIEVTYTN